MLKVNTLDHIVLNVRDVDVSADWYVQVLGMERRKEPGRDKTSVFFGTQKINLRPVDIPQKDWFTGLHPATGGADLCFLTDTAPDAVTTHLCALGIAIEQGPVIKQGAMGAIRSVYCRDPDGNLVEIASYPA